MCIISSLKKNWRGFLAVSIICTTVMIAGCPYVDDDLFVIKHNGGNSGSGNEDEGTSKDSDVSVDTQEAVCTLDYFNVFEPCDDGYQYMEFQCSNGTAGKDGGDSSCKPAEVWEQYARDNCAASCVNIDTGTVDTDTGVAEVCGVEDYSLAVECDGGYQYLQYVCADGSSGRVGDGSMCEPESVWVDYARKYCSGACIDTSVDTGEIEDACSVQQFAVLEPCDGGFRFAKYICTDGRDGYAGSDTSCEPEDVWTTYAREFCYAPCADTESSAVDTDTAETVTECGVLDFNVSNPCDGGYYNMDFVCADGTADKAGGGTVCYSIDVWKQQAIDKCNVPCM